MIKYTIGFIKRGDEILMLNREKSSWMGRWNGVGGKLESGETPTACILREIREETGIVVTDVEYKGTVTWNVNENDAGGMYAFLVNLPSEYEYHTPIKTDEGILDWKKIDWILHSENEGIANLKYYLMNMLEENQIYEHRFIYESGNVVDFQAIPLQVTR